MPDDDRPTLLARFRAEACLVAGGLDESAARRFGGWLASASSDAGLTLDERLLAIDPARLGAEALHAHLLLLGVRVKEGARSLHPPLIAACEALASGASEARLRSLMALAEVPEARRAALVLEVPRAVVPLLQAIAATDEGVHATRALRELASHGASNLAVAARGALMTTRARAVQDFEMRVAQLDAAEVGLDVPLAEEIAVFEAAQATDRRLDGDARFRRIVVTAILPIAWRRYTARKWEDLRALLATIEQLTDGLATELEAHPEDLAYRAAACQVLVFRAEVALTASRQMELAERALALCPTLRNARVVLASQLVARALRTPDPRLAERDLDRAHSLDPFHPQLKERVRKTGG